MDGIELIKWAVNWCKQYELPPTDANILMFIRAWQPNGTEKPFTVLLKQEIPDKRK